MKRLRTFFALVLSVWLCFSSSAAFALVPLAAEHEHEHASTAQGVHDGRGHAHADDGVELFSQIFGQSGLDPLISGWMSAAALVPAARFAGLAPVSIAATAFSLTPLPPPGPPPRAARSQRGGAAA